jgi:hypothetical protein
MTTRGLPLVALVAAAMGLSCAGAVAGRTERVSLALGADVGTRLSLPGGPSVVVWESGESYAGKAQADPRLDSPVKFWQAGISLWEALTQIEAQTEVRFEFWPPDDQNQRTPLTLFLDSADPPSVRSVMVQVAWVTDSSFAVARDGRGEFTYYVLSPSVTPADSVERDVSAAREAEMAQLPERQSAKLAQLADKLEEYKAALSLSPQELAARYRTGNDADEMLLLDMLDPHRRPAVELVCGLSDQDLQTVLSGERFSRDWNQWTQSQQALLRQGYPIDEHGSEKGAVNVSIRAYGDWIGVSVGIQKQVGPDQRAEWSSLGPPVELAVLRWSNRLTPDQRLDIARYLGEIRTSADEAATRARIWGREAAFAEQAMKRASERRAAQLAASSALSPRGEALLASFDLRLSLLHVYSLWQLQEAVATGTHLNVISDCYSQRVRPLREAVDEEIGPSNSEYTMSALEALRMACLGGAVGRARPPSVDDELKPIESWDWGDAGSFLRFRSQGRLLARAVMLPPEAMARLDAWMEAYLENQQPAGADDTFVPFAPATVRTVVQLLAGLSEAQLLAGGTFPYEDPADSRNAARQDRRSGLLGQMAHLLHPPVLRILASLSDEQWAAAQSGGLRRQDMTPEQQTLLRSDEWQRSLGWAAEGLGELQPTLLRIRYGLQGETAASGPSVGVSNAAGQVSVELRFDRGPTYVREVSPRLFARRLVTVEHLPPARLHDGNR